VDLVETAAYGNNTPAWHGKGNVFEGYATTDEILRRSETDWLVQKQPIFLADGTQVKGRFAIVRETDNKPLGLVKARYAPIQNREAFEFVDFLLAEKQAQWETAMSLRGGEQVVGLLKLSDSGVTIRKGDTHYHYLTVVTTHDGSGAARVFPTDVRVVCANTLALAVRDKDAGLTVNVRHTGNILDKAQQAVAVLAQASDEFKAHEEWLRSLLELPLTTNRFNDVASILFPEGEDETKLVTANREGRVLALADAVREEILLLPQFTATTLSQHATAYELFNGVTRYIDHTVGNKKGANRFEYAVLRGGSDIKQKAIEAINLVFDVAHAPARV
jgi:phage/plasmid-like protein (TIGR03299 family)